MCTRLAWSAYELLAGVKPYKLKRGSAAELEETIATVDAPLASATATDPAAKRDLRGDLDAILNKALKKNSNERYATVDALSQDIESHLAGHRVVARPDSLAYRTTRFVRRFRTPLIAAALVVAAFSLGLGVGAAALLAIVFAAGMGIALWQARAATRERDRALRLVERQEGVLSFLNTLITDAARGGRALTAEELLQRSEALIGPELESDAEVHAMVLSMISASMQTLGNSAEALRLSDRALGSGNGALRLTTARYVTPSGRSIQAKGISPDIEVLQEVPDELKARTDTSGEASLRGHLKAEGAEQTGSQSYIPPDPKDDKALHTALDLIRGIQKNSAYPPNPKTAVPN